MQAQGREPEERRPLILVVVYSWDLIQLVTALFVAFAAFAGSQVVHGRIRPVPVPEQLLAGLSAAAWAATFFIVGTLLTRRQLWVRRAQVVILAVSMALGLISLGVASIPADTRPTPSQVYAQLLIVLLNAGALAAMQGERVRGWFREPGRIPRYLYGTVGLWVAGQALLVVLNLG
ncbi:MAG: hypothetical protein ABR541_01890 [Candidatus Dormibacteria bacterium]